MWKIYLQSTEASSLQEGYDPELAGGCKREGDGAFGRKEFQEAESFYTDSLKYDASNHLVWANRSAARFRQGKAEGALQDAQKSRELDPKYLKVILQNDCAWPQHPTDKAFSLLGCCD